MREKEKERECERERVREKEKKRESNSVDASNGEFIRVFVYELLRSS